MQKKILNSLIDKYEKSKTFCGKNKVNQSFFVEPGKIFPKYSDESQYELFLDVNEDIRFLEGKGFVSVKRKNNDCVELVFLNIDKISAVYSFLNRVPREAEQRQILEVLCQYDNLNPVLQKYVDSQRQRIVDNKNVEFYDAKHGLDELKDVLKAVDYLLKNDEEILIRNASIHLYKDSKRLENISSTIEALLHKYGDYEGCEDVLAECNVVKTPTQVLIKGNASINLNGQIINLSKVDGDIGLSTKSLRDVISIDVFGNRVVTVENLTSFYTYGNRNDFVIYLGGFHNSVKRNFIKKVFAENVSKSYIHFGDIDAGGLYILKHLRSKTKIQFEPMFMDVETLKKYASCVKPLTKEDTIRLERLKDDLEFGNLVSYMIEHNCKLEQENVVAF